MNEVDEIKARIDIVDYISRHVALKKAGRNFKGLCPFHSEKTPSFMVSPERGMWHCFGCGRGGSVFDFLMEYEHVDFVEALETLAEQTGIKLKERYDTSPQAELKETIYGINRLAAEYYQYLLKSHAVGTHAREYLRSRGVSDKSVRTFGLGYSPKSWEGIFSYLKKKGYPGDMMEKGGLVIASQKSNIPLDKTEGRQHQKSKRYYDRFRGRIMFPLRDHRGRIAGFAGRLLDPSAKEAKYINTPETAAYVKSGMLFGLDVTKRAIQDADEAVVMEGELDVISSFQAGIGNAVAIKGSAITEGHVRLIRRFAKSIVFALDSDIAGDAAARRGIEIADKAGLEMRVASLEGGKDPDDIARENPSLLKQSIKRAVGVYDYFFSSTLSRNDTKTAYGKKRIGDELLPVLARMENPIVAGHYAKRLAGLLDVSEEWVSEGVARARRAEDASVAVRVREGKASGEEPRRSAEERLELFLAALLLQGDTPSLFEDLTESVRIDDFSYPPVRQILGKLESHLKKQGPFLVRDFADSLPPELHGTFDEAFLWDTSDYIHDRELFAKEWLKACRQFRRKILKKTVTELTKALAANGDSGGAESMRKKLQEASRELSVLSKTQGL